MTPDFDPAPIQFSVLLKATLCTGEVTPEILWKEEEEEIRNGLLILVERLVQRSLSIMVTVLGPSRTNPCTKCYSDIPPGPTHYMV